MTTKYLVYWMKNTNEDDKLCYTVYAGKQGCKPKTMKEFVDDKDSKGAAKDQAIQLVALIEQDPEKFGL